MAYAKLKILSVSLCYSKKRLSLCIIESEYHSKTFTIIVVSITINNIINSSSSLSNNFIKASSFNLLVVSLTILSHTHTTGKRKSHNIIAY